MKQAQELAAELRPFVEGRRNTCFSEISGLLDQVLEYLETRPEPKHSVEDPTIRNQLPLCF